MYLLDPDTRSLIKLEGDLDISNCSAKRPVRNLVISDQGLLPKGCIYTQPKRNGNVYVIEQEPRIRTINFLGSDFRLSFPYVIFIVEVDNDCNLSVFFRNEPVSSLHDMLYFPCLPNVSESNGKVCNFSLEEPFESDREMVEAHIRSFWSSTFNNDLSTFLSFYRKSEPLLSSFDTWQTMTKKDPMFILDVNFLAYKPIIEALPKIDISLNRIHMKTAIIRPSEAVKDSGEVIHVGDVVRVRDTDIVAEVDMITYLKDYNVYLVGYPNPFDVNDIVLVEESKEVESIRVSSDFTVSVGDTVCLSDFTFSRVEKICCKPTYDTILCDNKWYILRYKDQVLNSIYPTGRQVYQFNEIRSGDKVICGHEVKIFDHVYISDRSTEVVFKDGTRTNRYIIKFNKSLHEEIIYDVVVIDSIYYRKGFNVSNLYDGRDLLVENLTDCDLTELFDGQTLNDEVCDFSIGDKVVLTHMRFPTVSRISEIEVERDKATIRLENNLEEVLMSKTNDNKIFYRIPRFYKMLDEIRIEEVDFTFRTGMKIAMTQSCSIRIPRFRKSETFRIVGFVPAGFLQNEIPIMLVNNGASIWMVNENIEYFQFEDEHGRYNVDRRFPSREFEPKKESLYILNGLIAPTIKKSSSFFSCITSTYCNSFLSYLLD